MKFLILLVVVALVVANFPSWSNVVSEEEVLAYWTPARMAAAKPMPLLVVDDPSLLVNMTKGTEAVAEPYTTFPYKTTGKVYFNTGAGSASCTGAAIGGNLVLTAGHCVHDGSSQFYTNVLFVPQTKDGVAPLGNWVGQRSWTTAEWATGQGRAFGRDVGVFKVASRLTRTLNDAIGIRLMPLYNGGRTWNGMALGYPANIGGGRQMIRSSGLVNDGHNTWAPATMKIPSTQTYGASGGPWVDGLWIRSVNSYITSSGGYIYGPYLDTTIMTMCNNAYLS